MTKRVRIWPLLLAALATFLLAGLFMTVFINYIDDTNYGTANGLWKAVFISDYMQAGDEFDYAEISELSYVSNLLYFPVYAFIIEHWPESTEHYIMVRKMTIINGWFGALAIAAFFILIYLVTRNYMAATIASLFHLACGIFFSVSTNSDDIIPAYAFFVISVVWVWQYIQYKKVRFLLLASFFYAISWLFHWTMAIGPSLAFLAVILLNNEPLKKTAKHLVFFGLANLVTLVTLSAMLGADFCKVAYPGKSMDSGWLGWAASKFILLYTGMVQYILGGFQFNGLEQFYEAVFYGEWYRTAFIGGTFILLLLGGYGVYFFTRKSSRQLKVLGAFLLVNFLFGQLMNVYEFGTDLQFHIQPMIWLPLVFGLLLHQTQKKITASYTTVKGSMVKAAFYSGAIIFALSVLGYNIWKFRLGDRVGMDSRYVNEIRKLESKFDELNDVYFVTRGWDEFGNWAYALWGGKYRDNNMTITDFLRDYPLETPEEASDHFMDSIESKLDGGYTVIFGPEIIDRSRAEIVDLFSGFQQDKKTVALLDVARNKYELEPLVQTGMGVFYRVQNKTKLPEQ